MTLAHSPDADECTALGLCAEPPSVRFHGRKLCTRHLRQAVGSAVPWRGHIVPLLRPLTEWVLTLRDIKPAMSAGGIYFPESYMGAHGDLIERDGNSRIPRDVTSTGLVLAVGPGTHEDVQSRGIGGRGLGKIVPCKARVGTRIVFKTKFEHVGIHVWRGLSLVPDSVVYAEVEEEASQSPAAAAQ